jgi:hypothetical protein
MPGKKILKINSELPYFRKRRHFTETGTGLQTILKIIFFTL